MLRPSKEALNVCNINRDCKEDLSLCWNQTLNDELFSGDAQESLSMVSYADEFLPAYFVKDLAAVFRTIEEQDKDEQLSQPSDDFDITDILKKELTPLEYLEIDENFACSKNHVTELLLSEAMTCIRPAREYACLISITVCKNSCRTILNSYKRGH